MVSIKIFLACLFLITIIEAIPQNQQTIQKHVNVVFPFEDTNKNRTATHTRKPVYDPKKCDKENEYLYPGDNEADWVCDCKPGYLFHPITEKCYESHRKGPCQEGQYLRLSNTSPIPRCEVNPCRRDGDVKFQNRCLKLNGEEGCREFSKLVGRAVRVGVSPTTLELTCRDEDELYECSHGCCKKRMGDSIGNCNKNQLQ